MNERPILMCAEMVRQTLAGNKTQTRRVIRPQPTNMAIRATQEKPGERCKFYDADCINPGKEIVCPYGQPGDRLWVRETWQLGVDTKENACVVYKADGNALSAWPKNAEEKEWVKVLGEVTPMPCPIWKPSIYMPRWASRIQLQILSARIQRVQDISAGDIIAEGAVLRPHMDPHLGKCPISAFDNKMYVDLRSLWAAGWDSINVKRGFGWEANPWVWALTFRRI